MLTDQIKKRRGKKADYQTIPHPTIFSPPNQQRTTATSTKTDCKHIPLKWEGRFEFSLKVKLPLALKLMALSGPNKSANYLTLKIF